MFTSKHDRYRVQGLIPGTCHFNLSLAATAIFVVLSQPPAFAQSMPALGQVETSPFAKPLLGQVPANTALSIVAAGNSDRFAISPSLVTYYDTNILRRSQPAETETGNLRVTPGVSVVLQRSLGRFAFNASGTAGYDFNNRYRFLNRSRIDFSGGVRAPVGAICTANVTVLYDQYQFDLGDVTQTLGSTTRNQNYDLALGCPRAAGFSPVAGVTYHLGTSGSVSLYDYTQLSERGGVAYAKPSLGVVTLTAAASQLRRPNIFGVVGVDDGTNISSLTLSLERAVSHRVQMSLAAGYTRAQPNRAGVSSFAGLSFDGQINWYIIPLFSVTASAIRQVSNQNGISAAYVIRDDYVSSVVWQFSRASEVSISGSHSKRDFRGEGLTTTIAPIIARIRADHSTKVAASYHYDASRLLRIGLTIGHTWRTADNPLYNYNSTSISGSLGTHF